MKISGVYGIWCWPEEKWYIGESLDIRKRLRRHFGELRSNLHPNEGLQTSFNKYGEKCFSIWILEHIEDRELRGVSERKFIEEYRCLDPLHGFNRNSGGCRGEDVGRETRAKLSKSWRAVWSRKTPEERSEITRKRNAAMSEEAKSRKSQRLRELELERQRKMSPEKRQKISRKQRASRMNHWNSLSEEQKNACRAQLREVGKLRWEKRRGAPKDPPS